ncbi:hypothetical protein [Gillisia sp. Hel_I_86]|uniref:hypothetical protein n=1 Tax=Gillisia sp. Hel_I_86 TaxID=1249981 RepID=UPI00119F645A|nr:hypothetical protein [Gillisia sp. Hel_I_86]
MKVNLIFLLFLFTLFASAQKDTSRQLEAAGIKSVYINTDEVFKILIKTTNSDQISISTHSEGEYFNDITLNSEAKGNSLYLSTQFPEILQSGYDKLSAHKVFSLEVILEIPENLQVFIRSNIAAVEAEGSYNFIEAQLKSGYCSLFNFTGNALINTYNGAISIQTTDATLTASSRNGEVIVPLAFSGKHLIKATSINGAIRVVKN